MSLGLVFLDPSECFVEYTMPANDLPNGQNCHNLADNLLENYMTIESITLGKGLGPELQCLLKVKQDLS